LGKTYDELKHTEEDRVASHTAHPQKARIGVGLYIKGQISGNEDLDVEGKVEGPVQLGEGKLTVGTGGNLTGDVTAREVIIHGTLTGNLQVRDLLEIKSDGSAVGDVVTDRILIEEGAYFKGSIEIGQKGVPQSDAATAVPAKTEGNL
jgi:cytoskeletal protein CcmA (bactofilin family)